MMVISQLMKFCQSTNSKFLCSEFRLRVAGNGFGLGEVGDFNHKTSDEAPKFKFSKICHTKH